MSAGPGQGLNAPLTGLSDNVFFAHAAPVIQGRRQRLSVTEAAGYLYGVAVPPHAGQLPTEVGQPG